MTIFFSNITHRLWLMFFIILFVGTFSTTFAQNSIQLEVMAAEPDIYLNKEVGHAFMCLSIKTNNSIKEDCYGFYPAAGGIFKILGPGIVQPEPRPEKIVRFSKVTVSYKKPISEEKRGQIIKLVEEWNKKRYSLTSQNCIDFVIAIAQAVGWKTPQRGGTEYPDAYLKRLVKANTPTPCIPVPGARC